MARRNTSGFAAFAAAAIGVVIVSGLIGYYILGGARSTAAVGNGPETASLPPSVTAAPPPAPVALPTAPRRQDANFVAPGAPRIQIKEEKSAALPNRSTRTSARLHSADTVDIPTPDQEAQQIKAARHEATGADADSASSDSERSQADSSSPAPDSGNASSPTAPDSGAPSAIPPPPGLGAPGDLPSAHKPVSRPKPADRVSAPPKVQSGDTPPGSTPADGGSGTDGEAGQEAPAESRLYRVQTGSFADLSNARQLADSLRSKGYATSARAAREGGKTVYKVQVGAFRSRGTADETAQKLQKDGYPAYVSSGTP